MLVASSEKLLKEGKADLWDSGKVTSDQSIQVEYAGKPLESRMQCYWKLKIYATAGDSWSNPACWTMELLKPEDWKAKWIGLDEDQSTKVAILSVAQWIWFPEGDPAASAPAEKRYFRRSFAIPTGRKITAAVLKMTADNAFSAHLNGQLFGKAMLYLQSRCW